MSPSERAALIEELINDGFTFVAVKRNPKGNKTIWLFQPPTADYLPTGLIQEALSAEEREVSNGE